MECLRESRRNRFPQESAHRNHQAEPSEDYAGFANHPSGFEQRRICPAYFFMADGSHRIATESKGRNVLIESQYAVQELRTIPVQQSGNGLTTVRADVFNGVLDAEGRAGVNIQLPVATGAPGMLNATLTTRVFEPGGDASIYSQTVPFSPFTSYVASI